MLIRRKPFVFSISISSTPVWSNGDQPINNKRVSHGDEGIMGVVEGVVDVINIAFPPSYPRSRLTSFVIHSFSNSLIHFLNPLHFNNNITP